MRWGGRKMAVGDPGVSSQSKVRIPKKGLQWQVRASGPRPLLSPPLLPLLFPHYRKGRGDRNSWILTAQESGGTTRDSKASPFSAVLSQDGGSGVQPSKRLT